MLLIPQLSEPTQGATQITAIQVPAPLSNGSIKAVDRSSAYWAFRRVKQTALAFWDRSFKRIVERQCAWEAKAVAIVDGEDTSVVKARNLVALAADVVQDWWMLDDELTVRFGDGWEHEWDAKDGTSKCKPLECVLRPDHCNCCHVFCMTLMRLRNANSVSHRYPDNWLESVGFVSNAPPATTVWTVDRKLTKLRGEP